MTVFSPPLNPSLGISRQVQPRVLQADFGDGYSQRGGDGLNTIPRVVSLAWGMLSIADADEIEAFFIEQRGYLKFDWTDPADGVSRQYICKDWTRTSPFPDADAISATFELVFDL